MALFYPGSPARLLSGTTITESTIEKKIELNFKLAYAFCSCATIKYSRTQSCSHTIYAMHAVCAWINTI